MLATELTVEVVVATTGAARGTENSAEEFDNTDLIVLGFLEADVIIGVKPLSAKSPIGTSCLAHAATVRLGKGYSKLASNWTDHAFPPLQPLLTIPTSFSC